ncbi:TonB-dependent receptor [Novosphingobium sp. 1949]|uniref:TonB-dependent receptor n=1 Tax=Novosphingobium organovorum TaxID=2930092 RepID=A0ABT0BCG9_9SPHN|nr:TonB-dependent receptor [Novosphingobium organovorum]MCJ2182770.1 TonB-dependent receptor [Novosphingobium organovorum]
MSKARFRRFESSGLALMAGLGCLTFSAPAFAQEEDDPAAKEATGGEIIVTARRREERLVDVPIAVSSFSGEELAKSGALDVTEIAQAAPNVTLEPSRGTNSTLSAFIRGIGQQDPVSGFEQGVGIYLDDVYLNRPQAAVLDIYDVQRIEVLRGPQGTLYGRNTIGGAVKYVTKNLPLEPSFKMRGSLGSYKQADLVVTASTPLTDLIRVGGSVARLSRGGFGKNLTTGEENYNKDIWAGRASLELGGYGEPVLIKISGDYTKDNSNARGGHRLVTSFATDTPVLKNVYNTQGGLTDPKQYVEAYGFAINASADLSDSFTVKSISAWRKDSSASPIDFDALPAVDLDVPAYYKNEQLSQEFQLQYDNGGALQALVGFYYLTASADTQFDVRIFNVYAGLTAFTEADVDTDTWAMFGDFTLALTDRLSLSAGGRYTWDKRSASILRQNYLGGGSPVFGGAGIAYGSPSTDFTGSAVFKKFTPRVSLSFKPTPDHNIYGGFSQGFKGGGFDPRGVGVNAPTSNASGVPSDAEVADYLSFKPESVNSYEIGYKGNLMHGDLYVALAAFHMDYTDVQIPGSAGCTVGGLPTFCGIITNAGKAKIDGVELETNATLARDVAGAGDRITFAGSLGWINARYTEYIANIASVPTDVSKYRKIQNTPEWTGSGTLGYDTPMGPGELSLSGTVSFKSKTYQFEVPNPYLDQGAYALLDANIVYTAPGGRWSVGLHGKNLTNKRYKTSGYTFMATDALTGTLVEPLTSTLGTEGTLTAFYGNPRQVFVTASLAF